MLAQTTPLRRSGTANNQLQPVDRAVHDWYRFVLSFPPHLVRDYIDRFKLPAGGTVLDPFCGTGTTLVECKKLGLASVGVESHPMAHFASAVKVDWRVDGKALRRQAEAIAAVASRTLAQQGLRDCHEPLFADNAPQISEGPSPPLRCLPMEQSTMLLKNSISPLPLHRTLVLLDAIDEHSDERTRRCARLANAAHQGAR